MTLDRLPLRRPATVNRLLGGAPDWPRQLQDLGFVPGETVQVLHQAWRGDPLVVQVGASRFALRRAEAACVELRCATDLR